jgi:hypothetical protein
MHQSEPKPKQFRLLREGDDIIVAKHNEYVTDGIVTGLIVDVIGFPLLLVALVVGVWLILQSVFSEHSWLMALMGIMFAGLGGGVGWVFLMVQPSVFPFQCRFRKTAQGSWTVQRKLWFMPFRWRELGEDWTVSCSPGYMRGDWGYHCFIKTKKSKLLLVSSGVFTESKSEAHRMAVHDVDLLKNLFSVPGEFKRWD